MSASWPSHPTSFSLSEHVGQASLLFAKDRRELARTIRGAGMLNLQLKLGRVKKRLKWWNKNVFGNVFEMVKKADCEAQEALKRFEQEQTPFHRAEMNRTATELVLRLRMEEDFWKQKTVVRYYGGGKKYQILPRVGKAEENKV